MLKLAKRTWVLLVILLVIVIAAFCVDRFRGFFGRTELTRPGAGLVNDPEPFNPKEVKYEIFGTGSVATINYLDLDAQPQKAVGVGLPWTLTLTTTAPPATPNIVPPSDGGSISRPITVAGAGKGERTTDGANGPTFSLGKSS